MALSCDGWYTLLCKRIKDEQSVEQDVPFSLISALREGYFNDGLIKSSEGHQVPKKIISSYNTFLIKKHFFLFI